MTQPEKIDLIFNRASEYFGVSKKDLTAVMDQNQKSTWWYEKALIGHYAYDNTSLGKRKISAMMGYKHHSNFLHHYRKIQDELGETYGYEKTQKVYKELKEYIGL